MSVGASSGQCPFAKRHGGSGSGCEQNFGSRPRGCAFIGYAAQQQAGSLYGAPQGPCAAAQLQQEELKTMVELLLPNEPPKAVVKGLKNSDTLMPSPEDVLAAALGAPARRVLIRAEALGPKTGWRDGYLTGSHGFCPPDPSASPIALAACPGRVWSDLCNRMPGLVARGRIRQAILELPLVPGTPDVIPDSALWAATVCLGILASVYRYEERNDGHEGIVSGAHADAFLTAAGDAPDEEPETKGIPRNIAIPFRTICTRMGRPLPHLTQYDVSVYNFKIRDQTSVYPYVQRCENMDLRWPVFNDRAEAMFLLCMAESHGVFTNGVELVARCQERVIERDNDGLLRELIKLKEIIDQLGYVFHKISVNPGSGENFANPVEWGQRYAKFSAPLSNRVPALSGLALPVFQLLDAFFGRKSYDTFLGMEALHLRAWLPLNIRAFITAVERHYSIPEYIANCNDGRLKGIMNGLVESYAGERGFMGTHRYKVYGFLEVVAKTGRTETNGNAGASDTVGRPWEEVHYTLSESMVERLVPYRKSITIKPNEMRGCFEECRFKGRIAERSSVDQDPERNLARVMIDVEGLGMTYQAGDRLAIMPLNSRTDVLKTAHTLGLLQALDEFLPDELLTAEWKRYAHHETLVTPAMSAGHLQVRDILRKGHLAPLTKDTVLAVHMLLRAASGSVLKVLSSDTWPVNGSLGDLLDLARREVAPELWSSAFNTQDLVWLPKLIPIEVPRTYSISSHSIDMLPSSIELTVSRVDHKVSPLLGQEGMTRSGVSSGFLNPVPTEEELLMRAGGHEALEDTVLVGISRPLNFQLPISPAAPVVMFAGGSGIAPFRSFWQARVASGAVGRNILFLGVPSRKRFAYEDELRHHVQYNGLELHTAFSRDPNGLVYDLTLKDLVEAKLEPRYIDAAIVDQSTMVCDMVMPTKLGGFGAYLYICGSISVYETVISGIKRALYNTRAMTGNMADELLATAFAERRFMLDVFMTPRAMSYNEPTIPASELARHTGHREDSPNVWIAVHGAVYDVTGFLPIHPGGSLIVTASAGIDASKAFDDLAHTSNPEVMSLLSKYFIGYLEPKPAFQTTEMRSLFDGWSDYLRTCVENLTTLAFESKYLEKDQNIWFSGGYLNMGGVRKFYQFQSRLIQDGFTSLFGTALQELFLQLTFNLVSTQNTGRFPDVMGTIARAKSSPAATAAQKEIAVVGDMVCNSQTAQAFQHGILAYSKNVTALDIQFLEQIRDEVCKGMDAFYAAASVGAKSAALEKQHLFKLANLLVSILERVAERLDSFYGDLAALSLYHPEMENNPARARWKSVRRKIMDGSFFLLAQDISLSALPSTEDEVVDSYGILPTTIFPPSRSRETINFDQVLSQLTPTVLRQQQLLQQQMGSTVEPPALAPRRLAAAHTRRAENSTGTSSFNAHTEREAERRISTFINKNMKNLRRLSRNAFDPAMLEDALRAFKGGSAAASTSRPRPPAKPLPRIPPLATADIAVASYPTSANSSATSSPSTTLKQISSASSSERYGMSGKLGHKSSVSEIQSSGSSGTPRKSYAYSREELQRQFSVMQPKMRKASTVSSVKSFKVTGSNEALPQSQGPRKREYGYV